MGCGVGYFTAIIAEVVGMAGRVVAIEVDPELAARARQNLIGYSNVAVHAGDGAALESSAYDPGMCDAIFINAGVTHPHAQWLGRLNDGGRMIVPITIPMAPTLGKGVMAKITRKGASFAAQLAGFVAIYSCTSARDPKLEPLLSKAMTMGTIFKLKSIRRDAHERYDTCIVHGEAVCLSREEVSPGAS
jgi:protein-L-isoaspartate(D-aspartate) O-methyltransferase